MDEEIKDFEQRFLEYEKKERKGKQRLDNYWKELVESITTKKQRLREFEQAINEIAFKKKLPKAQAEGLNERVRLSFGGSCYEVKRAALVESDAVGWNCLSCVMKKRWERFLLQDKAGRIYMEYEREWMKPILQAIKGEENILLDPSPNSQAAWDWLLEEFDLNDRIQMRNYWEDSDGCLLRSPILRSLLTACDFKSIEKSLKRFICTRIVEFPSRWSEYDSYFIVIETTDEVHYYGQVKRITDINQSFTLKIEFCEPMKQIKKKIIEVTNFHSIYIDFGSKSIPVKFPSRCLYLTSDLKTSVKSVEMYGLKKKVSVITRKRIKGQQPLIAAYNYGVTTGSSSKIDQTLRSHEVMKGYMNVANESAALLAKMESAINEVNEQLEIFLQEVSFMQRYIYRMWRDIIPNLPKLEPLPGCEENQEENDDKEDEGDDHAHEEEHDGEGNNDVDDDDDDDEAEEDEEEEGEEEEEERKGEENGNDIENEENNNDDEEIREETVEEKIERHVQYFAIIFPLIESYKKSLERGNREADALAYFNVEGEKMMIRKTLLLREVGDSQLGVRLSGRWTEQSTDIDEEGNMHCDVSAEAFRLFLRYLRLKELTEGNYEFLVPEESNGQMSDLLDYLAIDPDSLSIKYV